MATTTIRRGATAGMVGGALWALMPAGFLLADIQSTHRGTLEFVAVATATWLFAVLPLALLLVALRGTVAALAPGALLTTATAFCGVGLVAMLVGNGTEMATLTVSGAESDLGHTVFLLGVLVLLVGELLLGIAVLRRRRDGLARAAGVVLALALPLGIGLGLLLNAVAPHTDAGFWAAITVPTGIGWLLLGRAVLPAAARERAGGARGPPDGGPPIPCGPPLTAPGPTRDRPDRRRTEESAW